MVRKIEKSFKRLDSFYLTRYRIPRLRKVNFTIHPYYIDRFLKNALVKVKQARLEDYVPYYGENETKAEILDTESDDGDMML